MNWITKGLLYWNTVKNLEPIQIKHQIINRIKSRRKPQKYDIPQHAEEIRIAIPELDADEEYLKRFDMEALMQNKVVLLYETHILNSSWYVKEASHLWNYNLHYLEFLIPLTIKYRNTNDEKYKEKYIEMLTSWIKKSYTNKDAYEPYTISMRVPNILIGLEMLCGIEGSLKRKIDASLYDQYKYLQQNLELGLLANHYFENLKTLVILSILFRELDSYHKYFDLFLKQIDEQILQDGLHYERSLMYHKIILEDILRVYTVLRSTGHGLDAEKLISTIKMMTEALACLENGFEHTPLFNDAGDNISKSSAALLTASRLICGEIKKKKTEFPNAGYYRLDKGNCAVFFDCGDIGPKYMGGHAHNDCLSFELSIDGVSIFTNSGTGQYQGDLRKFFRSTVSHNTMMIDDREQSELWGEHRVARRINHVRVVAKEKGITGQFESYQGDRFRRRLWWAENSLLIKDDIKCRDSDRHIVRQFFHLAPGYSYERDGENVTVINTNEKIAVIIPPENADLLIHTEGQITNYAGDFGKYEKKQVLEMRTPFENAVRLNFVIKIKHKE